MNAFDTNVLIYVYDGSEPSRQEQAIALLNDTPDAVILWQVACEFISASRKLASQGFSSQEAWRRLSVQVDAFRLVIPSREVLDRARGLHTTMQIPFWDAMIFAACLEANVQRIYSEDLPGCPIPGLEVVNPFTC